MIIILERGSIDRQGTDFQPGCIQFHAQILVTRKLEQGIRVWKRKHKFDLARKLVSFFAYLRPCVLLPLHLFPCHPFPYPDSCQQLLVLFSTSDKGGGRAESTETSIKISSKRSIDRVHKFGVQLVRANCLSLSFSLSHSLTLSLSSDVDSPSYLIDFYLSFIFLPFFLPPYLDLFFFPRSNPFFSFIPVFIFLWDTLSAFIWPQSTIYPPLFLSLFSIFPACPFGYFSFAQILWSFLFECIFVVRKIFRGIDTFKVLLFGSFVYFFVGGIHFWIWNFFWDFLRYFGYDLFQYRSYHSV